MKLTIYTLILLLFILQHSNATSFVIPNQALSLTNSMPPLQVATSTQFKDSLQLFSGFQQTILANYETGISYEILQELSQQCDFEQPAFDVSYPFLFLLPNIGTNAIYYCQKENVFYHVLSKQNFAPTTLRIPTGSAVAFDQIQYSSIPQTNQVLFLGYSIQNGGTSYAGIFDASNLNIVKIQQISGLYSEPIVNILAKDGEKFVAIANDRSQYFNYYTFWIGNFTVDEKFDIVEIADEEHVQVIPHQFASDDGDIVVYGTTESIKSYCFSANTSNTLVNTTINVNNITDLNGRTHAWEDITMAFNGTDLTLYTIYQSKLLKYQVGSDGKFTFVGQYELPESHQYQAIFTRSNNQFIIKLDYIQIQFDGNVMQPAQASPSAEGFLGANTYSEGVVYVGSNHIIIQQLLQDSTKVNIISLPIINYFADDVDHDAYWILLQNCTFVKFNPQTFEFVSFGEFSQDICISTIDFVVYQDPSNSQVTASGVTYGDQKKGIIWRNGQTLTHYDLSSTQYISETLQSKDNLIAMIINPSDDSLMIAGIVCYEGDCGRGPVYKVHLAADNSPPLVQFYMDGFSSVTRRNDGVNFLINQFDLYEGNLIYVVNAISNSSVSYNGNWDWGLINTTVEFQRQGAAEVIGDVDSQMVYLNENGNVFCGSSSQAGSFDLVIAQDSLPSVSDVNIYYGRGNTIFVERVNDIFVNMQELVFQDNWMMRQ